MRITYTFLFSFFLLVSPFLEAQPAYPVAGNPKMLPGKLGNIFGSLDNTGAVVYVKQDASGSNDGSSWENAYTDLKLALAQAMVGDSIWVAEGIYLPDTANGSPESVFLLDKNLALLGGFAGDESLATERDPEAHPVILSGDLNGDDISGDLDSNRTDNALTVLLVEESVTPAALIDGFTIRNGSANGGTSDFFLERGGGLFSFGAPRISHCHFSENYAFRDGGALYFMGTAIDSAFISHCTFVDNRAEDDGGAMMVFESGTSTIYIDNCLFENNFSQRRGGAVALVKGSLSIRGSEFVHNECLRSGGAISGTGQDADYLTLDIRECAFTGNRAHNGGALRYVGNAFFGLFENAVQISDCTFTENQALDLGPGNTPRGGALDISFNQQSNEGFIHIERSDFIGNSSENRAGAIRIVLAGQGNELEIRECNFLNNSAIEVGAVEISGESVGQTSAEVVDCLFEGNEATAALGGALHIAAVENTDLTAALTDCRFIENLAVRGGGALVSSCRENGKLNLEVIESFFQGNDGGERGGSIASIVENGNLRSRVRRSIFEGNTASAGCVFWAGPYFTPAFGIGSTTLLQNCLMHDNPGPGAVIFCDSFPALTLQHCTLAENTAFAVKVDEVSSLLIQNNVFFNPGYKELDGSGQTFLITSFGGNLLSDSTGSSILTATDLQGADPLFVGSGSYELTENSPAVDAGIQSQGLPAIDLAGNDRTQGSCVDMGAYESAFDLGKECLLSSTEERITDLALVELFPNPASHSLQLSAGELPSGSWKIRIFNVGGQEVFGNFPRELAAPFITELEVSGLSPGLYSLILEDEKGHRVVKRFVRQ